MRTFADPVAKDVFGHFQTQANSHLMADRAVFEAQQYGSFVIARAPSRSAVRVTFAPLSDLIASVAQGFF
ncbi:MAG: hypothetical protein AAF066_20060 [Pseudomonadota bacterium]